MRKGAFPAPDEPLDPAGERAAAAQAATKGALLTSPALAARQTAAALGAGAVDAALRDMEYGAWAGLASTEIPAGALAGWLADPSAGAPGGESLAAVIDRIRVWMGEQAAGTPAVTAVTHPMVIRAALAVALDVPPAAAMRIDVGPLSRTRLSFNRAWRLQALLPPGD